MSKISVVIPNYNRNDFLFKTLKSVLNQSINLDYLDIIVVDDCSEKEDPAAVINSFEPRVKLVRNVSNLGQIGNLNKCISIANCEYIHILHSDDLIAPYFYERVLNAFENNFVDVVFSSSYYINDLGSIIGKNEKVSMFDGLIQDIQDRLFVKQVIQTPSIVVKTKLYKDLGGFKTGYYMVEDWEMWIRLAAKCKFWYIADYLSYYRLNTVSTSSTNTFNGNFLKDLIKLQSEFYDLHRDKLLDSMSIMNYGIFFVDNAEKIRGIVNNINHLIYLKSNVLRLKFLIRKFKFLW